MDNAFVNCKYTFLSKPCRNFNVLGNLLIVDPKDNREKYVLSDANIIFVDLETGEGEEIKKPYDGVAWALVNLKNEKLVVGTVAPLESDFSYIFSLDLKTRTWAKPLSVEPEQFVWNLTMGSDGMLYGGTWPGCALLQYDPVGHTVRNLGRVSDEKNKYCRMVYGAAEGYLLIECGFEHPHIVLWNLSTREFENFGRPGAVIREISDEFICTETGGELDFYHPGSFCKLDGNIYIKKLTPPEKLYEKKSFADGVTYGPLFSHGYANKTVEPFKVPINLMKITNDGSIAGIRGQEYFIRRKGEALPVYKHIPAQRPVTKIMEITSDERGIIWGSCNFGQTIFRYDPGDGSYWNSYSVCDGLGEPFGMVFIDNKLFMAAYAGADHIVYDPAQAWDQHNNINPKTLKSAAPQLCRPTARSIVGPDGAFWTGWWAKYGTYGGGLSRVDPLTYEVTCWYDPIPGQNIACIACDDEFLYFTTSCEAEGLKDKLDEFYLAAWDVGGRIVRKIKFEKEANPGWLNVSNGYVSVAVGDGLRFYEAKTLNFLGSLHLGDNCRKIIHFRDQIIVAFCKRNVMFIDVVEMKIIGSFELPPDSLIEYRFSACKTPEGQLYFSIGSDLYRLDVELRDCAREKN